MYTCDTISQRRTPFSGLLQLDLFRPCSIQTICGRLPSNANSIDISELYFSSSNFEMQHRHELKKWRLKKTIWHGKLAVRSSFRFKICTHPKYMFEQSRIRTPNLQAKSAWIEHCKWWPEKKNNRIHLLFYASLACSATIKKNFHHSMYICTHVFVGKCGQIYFCKILFHTVCSGKRWLSIFRVILVSPGGRVSIYFVISLLYHTVSLIPASFSSWAPRSMFSETCTQFWRIKSP